MLPLSLTIENYSNWNYNGYFKFLPYLKGKPMTILLITVFKLNYNEYFNFTSYNKGKPITIHKLVFIPKVNKKK